MNRTLGISLGAAVAGILAAAALRLSPLSAADPVAPIPTTPAPAMTSFMQRKLESAHAVLTGLMTEDHGAIRKASGELLRLSRAAEWNPAADDPVYTHFSAEFQRLVARLDQAAAEKNLDGAAYTWQQVTATCLACHQHVRDAVKVDDARKPDRRAK